MSKHETPLTYKYWQSVGGLLITEFVAVPRSKDCGIRLLDAVIVLGEPTGDACKRPYDITDKDVICVQTKNSRLGMYVMGQALFSKELLETYHKPRSVKSVIVCTKDDDALHKLCDKFEIEVVVLSNNLVSQLQLTQ